MAGHEPPTSSMTVASLWPSLLVLGVLFGAWQIYVMVTGVPTVIFPSPVEVGAAALDAAPTLLEASLVTAVTAGLGLAGGIVTGLLIAFAVVQSSAAAAIAHPYLVALRVAPLVAIAPLVFLWIGTGIPARATLVTTMTVFPVAVASIDGLRSTPPKYLDLMRSVSARERDVFFRVRVPAAVPSVFAGVKLGAALSVIGAVVAEFLTLRTGIGYRVFAASTALDTAEMFAALFALMGLGLVFYSVPAVAERAFPWAAES